jgi:hypothetical protein
MAVSHSPASAARGPRREPFERSLSAVVPLVDPSSIDALGTTLANQVSILQAAGRLLTVNYRYFYENERDGWARLVLHTESLYQQIHAVATTAAVLVARTTSPTLKQVGSFHQLRHTLEHQPSHSLAQHARANARALDLLWWLCEVRNIALQHRAERGYIGNRGTVMIDGFALLRTVEPADPAAFRKASTFFTGLTRKYGQWNETPNTTREALTYLDLASHELVDVAPHDFDACRRIVVEASCHDLVVSIPLLENTDAAVAALLGLATTK